MSKYKLLNKAIKEHGVQSDEVDEILEEWNNGNTKRYLTTQQLAADYAPQNAALSGVDKMWQAVLRTQVMFEHEGYGPRMASMIQEANIIQVSAIMAACYIGFTKQSSSDVIEDDLANLKKSLERYKQAMKDASKNMEDRSKKYIVYYDGGKTTVTFNKALADIDVRKTIIDNQAKCIFKHDVHVTGGCNAPDVAKLAGIAPEFDKKFLTKVQTHFSKDPNNPLVPTAALTKCGFEGVNDLVAIFLPDEHAFKGDGRAECRNFRWRALRGSNTSDYLGFRGIVDDGKFDFFKLSNGLWKSVTLWSVNEIAISSWTGEIKEFKNQIEARGKYKTAIVVAE